MFFRVIVPTPYCAVAQVTAPPEPLALAVQKRCGFLLKRTTKVVIEAHFVQRGIEPLIKWPFFGDRYYREKNPPSDFA